MTTTEYVAYLCIVISTISQAVLALTSIAALIIYAHRAGSQG